MEVQAPHDYPTDAPIIFLGGAIDQGRAPNWQRELVLALAGQHLTLLNPRRDDWDSGASEDTVKEQIIWEHNAQCASTLNVYAFPTGTTAPVTMLELGLFGARNPSSTVVWMDPGFYRSLNIEVSCGGCWE